MVERWGPSHDDARTFPDARTIAAIPVDALRTIGLTTRRAETLRGVAETMVELRVERTDPEALVTALVALPGIGRVEACMRLITRALLIWLVFVSTLVLIGWVR